VLLTIIEEFPIHVRV